MGGRDDREGDTGHADRCVIVLEGRRQRALMDATDRSTTEGAPTVGRNVEGDDATAGAAAGQCWRPHGACGSAHSCSGTTHSAQHVPQRPLRIRAQRERRIQRLARAAHRQTEGALRQFAQAGAREVEGVEVGRDGLRRKSLARWRSAVGDAAEQIEGVARLTDHR